jgi:dienelactone hydrolase
MKTIVFTFLLLFGYCLTLQAAVVGKEMLYSAAGQPLKGYLAYDDAITGKRPGILVVHEWWGQNAYTRKRAEMLAELGYVAFALDMYGNGKTAAHPDEAGKFANEVRSNMPVARQRFQAAMDLVKQQPQTDAEQIGAIGYCFGGGIVLQMARDGLNLKGVTSFHGTLATNDPARKGRTKARILVCNGGADPFVPMEQIQSLIKEMTDAEVILQYHSYPDAIHAFTNPEATRLGAQFNIPIAYNEQADRLSWQDMRHFFRQVFPQMSE